MPLGKTNPTTSLRNSRSELGRFEGRQPEFQNLLAKPLPYFPGENPNDYNVRDTLLGADNVFSVDFANQEDRMSALYTKEPKDIVAFKEGRNLHQEMADSLRVTYNQGKRIRHGCRYGMDIPGVRGVLGCSARKAQAVLDDYRTKYAKTFEFIDSL